MAQYDELASTILDLVGGKENVNSLAHCVTRLRFRLKDESKVKQDELKSTKGVLGLVFSGGQTQVVIGPHVGEVYDQFAPLGVSLSGEVAADAGDEETTEKKPRKPLDILIDMVSNIMLPSLNALIAGGMIKMVLMIVTAIAPAFADTGAYALLYAVADATTNYLPVVLAVSAARYFKCDMFVSAALGVALCLPNIVGSDFFGIPILGPLTGATQGYQTTVLPIIAAVWFLSVIEHALNKAIKSPTIKSMVVPMTELAVAAVGAFLVIGPIMAWLQALIGGLYEALYSLSPIVCGIIIGGAWQALVIVGLHWGVVPVMIANLSSLGRDTILAMTGPSNWAQFGANVAVMVKTKDPDLKATATTAASTGLVGLTEPSIYGVNLPLKRPFYCALVGGALGGAISGASGSAATVLTSAGLFSFPMFFGEGFVGFCIAMVVAFALSFVLTYFFGGVEKHDAEALAA